MAMGEKCNPNQESVNSDPTSMNTNGDDTRTIGLEIPKTLEGPSHSRFASAE